MYYICQGHKVIQRKILQFQNNSNFKANFEPKSARRKPWLKGNIKFLDSSAAIAISEEVSESLEFSGFWTKMSRFRFPVISSIFFTFILHLITYIQTKGLYRHHKKNSSNIKWFKKIELNNNYYILWIMVWNNTNY